MKRFEFSLDKLLKVKSQLKRLAEMEEARANQAVITARMVVDGLRVQQVQVAQTLGGRLGQGVSPCQWVNVFELSELLTKQLDHAEKSVTAAEDKLRTANQERKAVSVEVEALTKLRQQKYDAWKRERELKDQQQLEEVGLRLWTKAQAAREAA